MAEQEGAARADPATAQNGQPAPAGAPEACRRGPKEKVYEGRGRGLSYARLATVSGRAADDGRLARVHLRLVLHVGRQNAGRGWLRLSQLELSEVWDVSRSRINQALRDLVRWGYLEMRGQGRTGEEDMHGEQASGECFCHYRVRLDWDGDVDVIDDHDTLAPAGDAKPSSARAAGGGVPPAEHECSRQGYTGVPGAEHSSLYTDIRRQTKTLPPTPRGGKGGEGQEGAFEEEGTAADGMSGQPPAARGGRRAERVSPRADKQPGWSSGWTEAARAEVAALRSAVGKGHVADFVERHWGTLRPPAGIDAPSYVRQLGHLLGPVTAEALAAASEEIARVQVRDMPFAAKVLGIATACAGKISRVARADTRSASRPARALAESDVRAFAAAMRRVEAAIGEKVFHAWLANAELDGVTRSADGTAVAITVPLKIHARYIERDYSQPLSAALAAEFPGPVTWTVVPVAAAPAVAATDPEPAAPATPETWPATGGRLREAQSPVAMQEIEPGSPRFEAWLAHWQRDGRDVAGLRRARQPVEAPAGWPPETAAPEVEPMPGSSQWRIAWGTPEHAAWLAALRRSGRARVAQSIDMGGPSSRPRLWPARWPEFFDAPTDTPSASRPVGADSTSASREETP